MLTRLGRSLAWTTSHRSSLSLCLHKSPLHTYSYRSATMVQVTEDLLPSGAKGLVFDVDGTLLNSNYERVHSWQTAAGKKGLEISKEKYMEETGQAGKDIVDQLAKEQGKDLSEEDKKEVVQTESEVFKKEGMPKAELVDDVIAIVKEGKKRNLKLAVASGGQKDVVTKILEDSGLGEMFDVFVTSKDVENAKPAPDLFLLAAEKLGLKPSECVAYEDAPKGFEAAEKAGYMKVINVTELPGHPQKKENEEARGQQ